MEKKDILTKQDKIFVKEMTTKGNGTQAALKAYGYKNSNTAGVMALDKLSNPKIQEAIKSIADSFTDEETVQIHKELLNSTNLDHMVFATGPKNEEDREEYIEIARAKADKESREYKEIDYVTDENIITMLAEINCKVRRIVHRETARDVYFWVSDNLARDRALEKVYKLKGSYAPEKKKLELDESLLEAVKGRVSQILT